MSFDDWMAAVDECLEENFGVVSDDLPDWDFWNAWDSGMSVAKACREIIKNAGGLGSW